MVKKDKEILVKLSIHFLSLLFFLEVKNNAGIQTLMLLGLESSDCAFIRINNDNILKLDI